MKKENNKKKKKKTKKTRWRRKKKNVKEGEEERCKSKKRNQDLYFDCHKEVQINLFHENFVNSTRNMISTT